MEPGEYHLPAFTADEAHGGAESGASVEGQAIPGPASLRTFRDMTNATGKARSDETIKAGSTPAAAIARAPRKGKGLFLNKGVNMGAPQTIYLILAGVALLGALVKNGTVKVARYSFWQTALGVGITIGLLSWGGFFG